MEHPIYNFPCWDNTYAGRVMLWVAISFETDRLTNLADRVVSNPELDTNPNQDWRLS